MKNTATVTEVERQSIEMLDSTEKTAKAMEQYYTDMLTAEHTDETNSEVHEKIDSFKRAADNLGKSYLQCFEISDELNARWNDLKPRRKRRRRRAPPNSVIDYEEIKTDHFAKGINLYKLLWLLFIGSFIGVVLESAWCIVTNGYLESRRAMVWGPFNLLYGVGAIALSVALYKFRNRGAWLSFIGGMVVGSAVEYVCSWVQEVIIGSRSWDYSDQPFNINGRICLLYSIFWGVLGVLWVKKLFPLVSKWILKLPNRSGKYITWAITAFFILDTIMTCLAMYRWVMRMDSVPPANFITSFIDTYFNNARMERIFPNMVFSK